MSGTRRLTMAQAVAEVSTSEDVRRARADYEQSKQDQRHYL